MSNTGPHKEPQIKLISKQSLPGPQRNVVESLKKEGVFKGTFGIKQALSSQMPKCPARSPTNKTTSYDHSLPYSKSELGGKLGTVPGQRGSGGTESTEQVRVSSLTRGSTI